MSFPEPPWHLQGSVVIVPRGVAGAGVFLADYQAGTLRYRELIVFARGFRVTHIYVDSPESLRGGHAIWGLPKELAEFELGPGTFTARQDGELLLRARIRRRRGFLPLSIPAPAVGDGTLTIGRAFIRAAPALVTLEGPFMAGTRLALAGDDLRLTMPAPLRRSAGTPARRTAS